MKTIQPLIIGNWKMHPQSAKAAITLAKEVRKGTARVPSVTVGIAPPAIFLCDVAKINNGGKLRLVAQNVDWEKLGAKTGEISLPMVASYKATHVIIGHSERRAAGETDEEVNMKLLATAKAGLTGVVCVGERKRDSHGQYFGYVEEQVRSAFAGVPKNKLADVVIAYEPVWAIGTGANATPEDAHEMKLFIQKVLSNLYGRSAALRVRILYGGSVNAKNAEVLFTEGSVDGFLIGGASLRAEEFVSVVKTVSQNVSS